MQPLPSGDLGYLDKFPTELRAGVLHEVLESQGLSTFASINQATREASVRHAFTAIETRAYKLLANNVAFEPLDPVEERALHRAQVLLAPFTDPVSKFEHALQSWVMQEEALGGANALEAAERVRLAWSRGETCLDLRQLGLQTVPPIGYLKQLVELQLADNEITRLPREIGDLPNLERLDVSMNSLVSLPADLGRLPRLREVHAGGNSLRAVPEQLARVQTLEVLSLWSNPIRFLPAVFAAQLPNLSVMLTTDPKPRSILWPFA